MSNLIKWDVYQINTEDSKIHGVKLRGRIRKFALENEFNLLIENATDEENVVRLDNLMQVHLLVIGDQF